VRDSRFNEAGLPLRPQRRSEAQSVRRHDRRADPQGQAVLLRRAADHDDAQNPLDQTAFVPTAAMLAGDFTAFRRRRAATTADSSRSARRS
jgi:hypothetical protein